MTAGPDGDPSVADPSLPRAAQPPPRQASGRTYSWHFLTPLPLVAALLGVAVVTVLTLTSMSSIMHTTDQTLVELTSESHDAGHIWVDLATQRAFSAEVVATGTMDRQTLVAIEQATAQAHSLLVHFGRSAGAPADPATYSRALQEDDAALPLQQDLLHALATGQPVRARAVWGRLNPVLAAAEGEAHALWHATYRSFPVRVAAVMESGTRAHRRLMLLAFALVAGEFALISIWAGHTVAQPLKRFAAAAASIRDGNLAVTLPQFRIREFTALAGGFNTMASSLQRMRADEQDVHRQALAIREERAALIQRQLGLVIQGQEEERRRVARDLHDETAQALTAVHLSLQRLAHGLPGQAQAEVASLALLVRDTMSAVRNLAVDLRPPALDELGLVPALQEWLDRLSARVSLEIVFDCGVSVPRLSHAVEIAVFRVAQEAVSNAARHAVGAHTIWVHLHSDGDRLRLEVADDGAGFDPKAKDIHSRRGLGLFSMQERSSQIGAQLTIDSSPGSGSKVQLMLPYVADAEVLAAHR